VHQTPYATTGLLIGRRAECAALDRMITALPSGESRVLVVHGPAGVGKSALMDYIRHATTDARLPQAIGVRARATCRTANGCAARNRPPRDASSCARRTRCSCPSAWIEWHLRRILAKLGVSSRRRLGDILPRGE
jgi:hypothetical protein